MVRRGDQEDPVLTEYVKERLARLVAENRPRRAHPAPEPLSGVERRPVEGGLPEFLPSDDEENVEAAPLRPSPPRPEAEEASSEEPPGELSLPGGLERRAPRRGFGRSHLGVVAVLLLVGLLCSGWLVLRARPVAMASSPVPVTSVPPGASSTGGRAPLAAGSKTPAPKQILVHVLGAVRKPGVVTLAERARVRDAIEAAGGLTRAAAPDELNLAQLLGDGQQIVIGTVHKPSGEVRSGSASASIGRSVPDAAGSSAVVDLNSATQIQLEELPGVGPVTAAKIIAWREQHGRFSRVEELQEVDGIGPKTYAQIAPHARV